MTDRLEQYKEMQIVRGDEGQYTARILDGRVKAFA